MSVDKPTIAAIRARADLPVDTILAETIAALRHSGLNVGGIIQEEYGAFNGGQPITRLRDISDGSLIQISQDLGRDAHGCRLDAGSLVEAASRIESAIEVGIDLLVLNRFGKSEAEGSGLRFVIERAILVGVPVLTAVRNQYVSAWNDFYGGMATWLPASPKAIFAWCEKAVPNAGWVSTRKLPEGLSID
jgi:hypothetical protein